jgi:Pyruvate/2-oxoacid:ferredoxin oxidoreductase gamma subunit
VTFEIRIHGRGGQGVVTAAELLAAAAFAEGRHAQAFPSFGSERTGAPVVSFCRVSDRPIRTREPVMHPDALIIQDPTLLHQVDVFEGIASGAIVLVNSARGLAELGITDITDRLGPIRRGQRRGFDRVGRGRDPRTLQRRCRRAERGRRPGGVHDRRPGDGQGGPTRARWRWPAGRRGGGLTAPTASA